MINRFATPEEYSELAEALWREGRIEESLAVLTDASQRDWPGAQRGMLLYHLAHFHSNVMGRHEDGLALAYQAISALSAEPTTIESNLARIEAESLVAHELWDKDRLRASEIVSDGLARIRHLIAACEHDQNTLWQVHYAAARLQALSEQWEEAIESARRAAELAIGDDQRIFPLVELGVSLRTVGRSAEARFVLEEALRMTVHGACPPDPRIDHELALVERDLGNWEAARLHIEKAIDIVRHDVYMRSDIRSWKTLHFELSEILRELRKLSEEAQLYRDLIGDLAEDDEDIWVVRLSLARCETELLRFEAAKEILEVIQRSAPTSELRETAGKDMNDLLYRIALRAYEIGDYERSNKELEAILPLCEGDPELSANVLIQLGNGYVMLRNYTKARSFYYKVTLSQSARRDQRDQAEESIRRLARF